MLLDVVECYTFCLFIFILLSLPPVLLAGSIFNCWRVSTLSHHTQHSLALSLRIKFLSSHSIEIETLFLTSMLGVIWLGINGCYKRLDEYSGNVIRQPWECCGVDQMRRWCGMKIYWIRGKLLTLWTKLWHSFPHNNQQCGMCVLRIENKEKRFPIIVCLDKSGGKRCSLNHAWLTSYSPLIFLVPDMKSWHRTFLFVPLLHTIKPWLSTNPSATLFLFPTSIFIRFSFKIVLLTHNVIVTCPLSLMARPARHCLSIKSLISRAG